MAWLTATQALDLLRVRPQTLYAQVSRKQIRARPDPEDARRSLYLEQDVRRQAQARDGRRREAAVAEGTIGWGAPVLQTRLCTVQEGQLHYRGLEVVALARQATLESVARLLWEDAQGPAAPSIARAASAPSTPPGLAGALARLAARTAQDAPTHGRTSEQLRTEAWSVLHEVADGLLGTAHAEKPLHERAAAAWHSPQAAARVRQALVLLAEHELTASSFAARVTASTGASLAACVLSGMATLGGPLHGGAHALVRELVQASLRDGPQAVLRARMATGPLYPAFGHPLYPHGDPRARALLEQTDLPPGYAGLQAAALELGGEHPSVDFALAALAGAHGWPEDAPLLLFALGRCVGWLAHALEQVATGSLIRPRARYVGPPVAPPHAAAPAPGTGTVGRQRAPRPARWFPE